MAATADHEVKRSEGEVKVYQLAAATKIYKGTLVGTNSAGYLVAMLHSTASLQFQGVALEQVDNTAGAAGALSVRVRRTGEFSFAFNGGGAVQANVGSVAYAYDNITVDTNAGNTNNDYPVGVVVEVVSGTEVRIAIDGFMAMGGSIVQSQIAANSLDGTVVASGADNNVLGAIPVLFRIAVPDAATGNVDVTVTNKVRVVDAWFVKTAGNGNAGNSIQVANGATAITDAMAQTGNDQVVVRAGTIDDSSHEIAAAGTLRVIRTKAGGNAACIVYVLAERVA